MVQAIAFWTLYSANKNQEAAEINNRLSTAKTIFTELFERRLTFLAAFAETAAKDYGLKEVFDDDSRSLLVALNNHRKRIDADLAMTISADGVITGQLQKYFADGADHSKIRQGSERNTPFRFAVGAKTIGWIAFGFQIDQRLATEFSKITGLNTVFIINYDEMWRLIASSQTDADSASELNIAQQVIQENTPANIIATYSLVTEFELQQLGVAMYGLRADFVALLQEQWWRLLMLAALTLLASLASAYLIAASISKPIKRLVTQAKVIASGDYQQTVTLQDKNEIGQLAQGFNQMQAAVLQREEAILHSANHDTLTDLPNRNVLNERLATLTAAKQHFVVLHLNIKFLVHLGADEFVLLADKLELDDSLAALQAGLEKNFD